MIAFRFFKSKKGAYTAELAVILPLIIFLTAGSIILSLTIWAKIVVTDAAREGARYVALNYGPTADTKVNEVLADGKLDPANLQSVTTIKDANYVTVTVKYNQPAIVPLLPQLLGGSAWGTSFLIESSQIFKLEKP